MSSEQIIFLQELLKRIASCYNMRTITVDISIGNNTGRGYFTIDLLFKTGNSNYGSCIICYHDPEDFKTDEILEEFDKIVEKAKMIL